MSKRYQPEYRTSSAGGSLIVLVAVLAVVLVLSDEQAPTPPAGPDINISIDVPTSPTTISTPTSTVDLPDADASGRRKQDAEVGVGGEASIEERATEWAQDFVQGCIVGQLTGRGLCLPWPDHLP